MISRIRAKRLIAQLLLLAGVAIALGAVILVGRFVLQSSTGADSASALHEVSTLPADAEHLVSWQPDAWTRERQLEPANRTLIEAAYIRAWAALGHYQTSGNTDALTDTFTGRARTTVLAMPRNERLATWDLGHELTLQFYALDGGTVAFTDGDAALARTIRVGADGDQESVLLSHETYDVVMALVDGYWRIDQLRRGPDPTMTTVRSTGPDQTVVTGSDPRTPVDASAFRATEYRPPWWTVPVVEPVATETTAAPIDPAVAEAAAAAAGAAARTALAASMTASFRTARDVGVTALRVPMDYLELGGPNPSAEALATVQLILTTAAAADLGVIFVLFDGVHDLSPSAWPGADRQLAEVVLAVRDSPALVGWDLADQPEDRTDDGATATEIRAFLVYEATRLHGLDPATPVTISWRTAAAALDPAMVGLVDVVSVHVDGLDGSEVESTVARLQAASGGRPIAVVSDGPATDGGWSPFPRTENRQAAAVAELVGTAERVGVDRVSIAALADSTATGERGLLRADGSAKPAARLIAAGADLASAPQPGFSDVIGANFWRASAVLVALIAAAFLMRRRLPDRRRLSRRLGRHREGRSRQPPPHPAHPGSAVPRS